jgi:hypothetical protein
MKAIPITQKAKKCHDPNSPAKANMALIYGAADIGASKLPVDPGKAMSKGLDKASKKYGDKSIEAGGNGTDLIEEETEDLTEQ